eukprot:tig00020610_g12031.t1
MAAASLEGLPGDLLSRILQFLPVHEAFRARRVSRAFRDAVEGTTFDGGKLEVLFQSAAVSEWTELEALNSLERLVREGRLKGRDLSVSLECAKELESHSIGSQPAALLAALAARCRSVRIKFVFPYRSSSQADDVLRRHVADVLAALAPGGAAGPLQELELLSTIYPRYEARLEIPADCLAPFSGLRALCLAPSACLHGHTAAAIAARLPALRSLQLCYDASQPDVLKRIGHLSLERLILHFNPFQYSNAMRLGMSLAELSGTPLENSLRELHFESEDDRSRREGPALHPTDLGALARMPQLERVTGYPHLYFKNRMQWRSRSPQHVELASVLRAPRLATLQLSVQAVGAASALSTAVAEARAAGRLPSLRALDLRAPFTDLEWIVGAGAGPLLRHIEVACSQHCSTAKGSAALLRCPRLEKLVLRINISRVGSNIAAIAALARDLAPLAALPALPGGFRIELSVPAEQPAGIEALASSARGDLSAFLAPMSERADVSIDVHTAVADM